MMKKTDRHSRTPMHNMVFILLVLLLLLTSTANATQFTATYSINGCTSWNAKTNLTSSGNIPAGSSATHYSNYNEVWRITSGRSMYFTFSGYDGMKIVGLRMTVHNDPTNRYQGSADLTMSCGGTTIASVPHSNVSSSNWIGKKTDTFTWCTIPVTPYTVKSGEVINMVINCGITSFYCQNIEITYDDGKVASGYCGVYGENILWELTSDSVLTLSGKDAMQDYQYSGNVPWSKYQYNIKKCIVGEGITRIGNKVFQYCQNITEVSLPNSLTSIGNDAFSLCNLKSLTIPNSVVSIGNYAFAYNSELTSLYIPECVSLIDIAAFVSCRNLCVIKVDANNKTYDSRDKCNAIIETATNTLICSCDSTIIPSTVTKIGACSFNGTMTSITIPEQITNIGSYAFGACWNVTEIYSMNPVPPVCEKWVVESPDKIVLYVPKGSKKAYAAADYWKDFKSIEELAVHYNYSYSISDNSDSYTNVGEDGIYTQIDYTRNFSNIKWQALYVPFSIAFDEWVEHFELAAINDVHQWDDNGDGVIDRMELEVIRVREGQTEPNTPYLIRAYTPGEKTITAKENTVLYATEINSLDCSSMNAKFTFTGTYNSIVGSTMMKNGYYAMAGGKLSQAKTAEASLNPFRWYLSIEARESAKVMPESVNVKVIGDFEDDANGIENVGSNDAAVIKRYSLNGNTVSKSHRGITIIKHEDGSVRKVFVK